MSFFKKKDENKKTIRPKLRPANFNPSDSGSDPQEKSGTSGKGGGEATPTYDTSAPDWNKQVAKFNKKGGINNDGRFGYGYVDTQTGIEVPWYIDMINGGGANAAGDTFVSPFENAPMGGGLFGIGSQAISGGLNAMNVAPYGSNRPRYFMPMEAARVGSDGRPVQVDLGAAPSGNGSGGSTTPVTTPVQPAPPPSYRYMSNELGRGIKVPFTPDPYGAGASGEMTMPNYTPNVGVPRIEMNTMSDLSSGTAPKSSRTIGNFPEGSDKTVSGSSLVPPAIFSAGAPSVGDTYTPPPSNAGLGLGKGMFITDYVASKGLPVTQENIMALMDEYMALGYGGAN